MQILRGITLLIVLVSALTLWINLNQITKVYSTEEKSYCQELEEVASELIERLEITEKALEQERAERIKDNKRSKDFINKQAELIKEYEAVLNKKLKYTTQINYFMSTNELTHHIGVTQQLSWEFLNVGLTLGVGGRSNLLFGAGLGFNY